MNAITLHANPSPDFEDKLAETIALLQQAAVEYAPITQASSLGAEDMVITDLLNRSGIEAEIFVLDTGKLHAETLALVDRVETHYGIQVSRYRPDAAAVAAFEAAEGESPMFRSVELRKACCHLRKLEPLARALTGKRGWVTGLRREQSGDRSKVELFERPDVASHGNPKLAKFNPLARWTWGDVWHYIQYRGIPYNPLHDQFYPSIGCAPCTRAVTLGEDFRSGRWWWEQEGAKECGLHVGGSISIAVVA